MNLGQAAWRYEVDESPKRKHAWEQPHAGFVRVRGALVGKCPSGLTLGAAETLLNAGIPVHPPESARPYPVRIYVVHDGIVYRATPTRPGVSYHGFPEVGAELRKLPRSISEQILSKAATLGCAEAVSRWIAN